MLIVRLLKFPSPERTPSATEVLPVPTGPVNRTGCLLLSKAETISWYRMVSSVGTTILPRVDPASHGDQLGLFLGQACQNICGHQRRIHRSRC